MKIVKKRGIILVVFMLVGVMLVGGVLGGSGGLCTSESSSALYCSCGGEDCNDYVQNPDPSLVDSSNYDYTDSPQRQHFAQDEFGFDSANGDMSGTSYDGTNLRTTAEHYINGDNAGASVDFSSESTSYFIGGADTHVANNLPSTYKPVSTGCPSCNSPSSSPVGGGGGGGGGGQSFNDLFKEALSAAQQVVGVLQPIGEELKKGGNTEGSTFISDDGSGGMEVELEDGAEFALANRVNECKEVCDSVCYTDVVCIEKDFNGEMIEECTPQKVCKDICEESCTPAVIGIKQINEDGDGSVTTFEDGDIEEFVSEENTQVKVPGQVIAQIPEGVEDTSFYNGGIKEDYEGNSPVSLDGLIEVDPFSNIGGGGGFSAMVISEIDVSDSTITGNVFLSQEQFVKLAGHNLVLKGEGTFINLLKSFRVIRGNGNLEISNGESKIQFNGAQTYYNRRIMKVYHNISSLDNELDNRNVFMVFKHLGERHRLFDDRQRVSVGNMWIDHPTKPGIKIAAIRGSMWDGIRGI